MMVSASVKFKSYTFCDFGAKVNERFLVPLVTGWMTWLFTNLQASIFSFVAGDVVLLSLGLHDHSYDICSLSGFWVKRSSGERNGYSVFLPGQIMDRGAWREDTVMGSPRSDIQ